MDARTVSGNAKLSKTGIHLSPTLLANYGFDQGDEFQGVLFGRGEDRAGACILETIFLEYCADRPTSSSEEW